MDRYSIIENKNKREIVLLRGSGCIYKKCVFCDYHTDKCENSEENFKLNSAVLKNVTGKYGDLEVINSGSVFELDKKTLEAIKKLCYEKSISTIHFESHYLYRNQIPALRSYFEDFDIKMKLGLETFDYNFRENKLKKGISEKNEKIISQHFEEANFLFGIDGQSEESMISDIELGLENFERICVNLMCENSTKIKPSKAVTDIFIKKIYPVYKENPRIDILINNTDFGVGD